MTATAMAEDRFLQGRHEILAREYRAIRAERDTLDNCVTMLERRLLDEQPGEKTTDGATCS